MKEEKAVLINVEEDKEPEVIDFKEDLETFYKLIHCDAIDIVRRKLINGKIYHVICDDEGLLKDHPKLSAVDCNLEYALYGNLIIAGGLNHNDGSLYGITETEAKEIIESATVHIKGKKSRIVIFGD